MMEKTFLYLSVPLCLLVMYGFILLDFKGFDGCYYILFLAAAPAVAVEAWRTGGDKSISIFAGAVSLGLALLMSQRLDSMAVGVMCLIGPLITAIFYIGGKRARRIKVNNTDFKRKSVG